MDPVAFARVLGLDAVLSNQQGVIRRDQAVAAGVPSTRIDDLVRRRVWVRILPRVFAVGVDPTNPHTRVRATWLWAGDSSTICGPAAAWWWGLSKVAPAVVTVIVPPPSRRAIQPGVKPIRTTVDVRDTDFENWVRVTTVPRTCLDLARQGGPDQLEVALRLRRADAQRLEKSLARSRGRRGQVLARQAALEVATNPWSYAERTAHRYLKEAGITDWMGNPPIRLRSGIRHPDIAVEDIKLAIELDGREHHTREGDFENDHSRHNDFVREGWTVLGFTANQVTAERAEFIASIREMIEQLRKKQAD